MAEQERDARDLADVTTEVEAAEVEAAYLAACAEAVHGRCEQCERPMNGQFDWYGRCETCATTTPRRNPMSDTNHPTPAEALADWEHAEARRAAAKREQIEADTAWQNAGRLLAWAIERAGVLANTTVLIGRSVVTVERHGGDVLVEVETPPVLG